ncbi:hypothetical protein ACPA9J_02070 [Pseudomonas aeruginosa]
MTTTATATRSLSANCSVRTATATTTLGLDRTRARAGGGSRGRGSDFGTASWPTCRSVASSTWSGRLRRTRPRAWRGIAWSHGLPPAWAGRLPGFGGAPGRRCRQAVPPVVLRTGSVRCRRHHQAVARAGFHERCWTPWSRFRARQALSPPGSPCRASTSLDWR